MNNYKVQNLTAFVPAKDYVLSKRFYNDLGFREVVTIKIGTRFEIDGYGFWLQNYYVEEWAGNFMLCLYVQDIESWSTRLKNMHLEKEYDGKARLLSGPHSQEGGIMLQFADPSGVLWHVRQDG
jgi:hypothetical protein